MFKSVIALSALAAASAQLTGNGITDMLLMDKLVHRSSYYGHDSAKELLALSALGGGGDPIMFEEYMLWDNMMHGGHTHGSGRHGFDDLFPLVLLGEHEGMGVFDTLHLIHEWNIVRDYDEQWGTDGVLPLLAGKYGDKVFSPLHDLHVIQGVRADRHNGNGADLAPLAFLTSGGDPDVAMENMHQYHYLQQIQPQDRHNDFIPISLLAGGLFNSVEPMVPFWALDQLINGDEYAHNAAQSSHHAGHGSHHGSSAGHGSRHYGSRHHGSRHHGSRHYAPVHAPVYHRAGVTTPAAAVVQPSS
jgi:hypothetical protein